MNNSRVNHSSNYLADKTHVASDCQQPDTLNAMNPVCGMSVTRAWDIYSVGGQRARPDGFRPQW
jgi:hypothetical protein